MNDSQPHDPPLSREQTATVLFAQMVLQVANTAMMLMGKLGHPEGGEAVKDLQAARMFIDQLEMLETKTKGNLNKEETDLLKQSLMSLHLAFVEAADAAPGAPAAPTPAAKVETPPPAEESAKKFTKKY